MLCSVAEISEKPLYRVTCGDIGTEAEEVERYLETVMYLGKIWNCGKTTKLTVSSGVPFSNYFSSAAPRRGRCVPRGTNNGGLAKE